MRAALAGLLLAACAGDYDPRPGQGELVAAVGACMGAPAAWDPPVRWFADACPGLPGPAAVVVRGACYAGWTWPWGAVWVADRGDAEDSALAHELVHSALIARGEDPDPGHRGPAWDHCAGEAL